MDSLSGTQEKGGYNKRNSKSDCSIQIFMSFESEILTNLSGYNQKNITFDRKNCIHKRIRELAVEAGCQADKNSIPEV